MGENPELIGPLEQAGAVERDGESWRVTEHGQKMLVTLAKILHKSGDDGINFDYEWQKADKAFDHAVFDAKCKAVDDEVFGSASGKTKASLEAWMDAHERIMKDVPRPPFKPNAMYNKCGDGIQVYLCTDESYTQWLCPGVEVMRAFSDNRIVGFSVWGLKRVVAEGDGELRALPDEDERFLTVQARRPPDDEPALPSKPIEHNSSDST